MNLKLECNCDCPDDRGGIRARGDTHGLPSSNLVSVHESFRSQERLFCGLGGGLASVPGRKT